MVGGQKYTDELLLLLPSSGGMNRWLLPYRERESGFQGRGHQKPVGQHTCGTGERSQTSQLRPSQTVHTSGSAKDIYEVPVHATVPTTPNASDTATRSQLNPQDVIDEFVDCFPMTPFADIFGIANEHQEKAKLTRIHSRSP